jgi:hypothetical protein
MDTTKTINIAREYSRYPTGRYREHSNSSGEGFRDDILIPAIEKYDSVVVILDGTEGYGSSFLDEAFAQTKNDDKEIIRKIKKKVQFVSDGDQSLIQEIYNYIDGALEND